MPKEKDNYVGDIIREKYNILKKAQPLTPRETTTTTEENDINRW